MNKKKNQMYDKDDTIDLIEILAVLWKRKIFIIKITLIFTFIGIIYSISLKNNYTASSVFYPHYQSNEIGQGGLKSLAGLAGINLESQGSVNIPPTLYPNIINSPQFKIEILNHKIDLDGNKLSYREYMLSKPSKFNFKKILTFPISIISNFIFKKNELKSSSKNGDILKLSEQEYLLHENLSDIIFLELNDKEGFIKLSVKENNPIIASQIAKISNQILQKNIIDFKLKNLNDTFKFISKQLDVAKINFYKLQDSLAIFSDKNKNIKSDLFLNKYSRIESEYNIAKNIYNELALSKEKTAIDVQKNTPIFTIIKPVVIPNEKSDPQRTLIVIVFSFIGLIFASTFTLTKPIILEIWKEIRKN